MKMETSIVSVAVVAVLLTIATFSWKILNGLWLRPKQLEKALREAGFSGNPYRFLYGDMKEMFELMKQANSTPLSGCDHDIVPTVIPLQSRLIKKYGQNSFMWFGATPEIFITNPDLLKEIFAKIYEYQKPVFNYPFNLIVAGIVSSEGDKWGRHRKIINPAFHLEKLKHMLPAFSLSCTEMVNKWENLISSEGSCELDVWPYLQDLTADVISRTAFGSSFEEGRRIFVLLKESIELWRKAVRSGLLSRLSFLPTKLNIRIKEVDTEIKHLLKGVITKRQMALKQGGIAAQDLLGVLLESNRKEANNTKSAGMSTEEVIEECKVFYLAGQETTSALLLWSMVLLSKNQEWQERAREEVLRVFGKEKPNVEGLNQLKIVTMIINEVIRLYPPTIMVVRAIHKDMKLGNFVLPAGVNINIPIIHIHHDHKIWGDDADEFKPERFSNGVLKATNGKLCFLPFGWGPRICIGQNMSLMETKLVLATILQNFSFKLSPSYTHAPSFTLTLKPEHGAHIVLHKI